MEKNLLHQLAQNLFELRSACQKRFSLDAEIETVFQELTAEISSHHQHHLCEQDDQLLYLEIVRCFDKIHSFLSHQQFSTDLQRMAENLLEILSCQEFARIAQYFV